MRILSGLFIAGLLMLPVYALAGDRVALLVGNSKYYRSDLTLQNPENDVEKLGAALRDLGFSVTEVVNENLDGMQSAVDDFRVDAYHAEIALFYYAGHGVQIGGENYLIGTDFTTINEAELRRASVTMASVRDAFEAAAPDIGILMLDACRNNPFADSGQVEKGLVRTKGGAGLLIAYATDPGNVAFDGTGANSVFTSALLNHMDTPGLEVRLMLGRVRQQVVLETRKQQVPWVEEAVLGEHFFVPPSGDAAVIDPTVREFSTWRKISASKDTRDFAKYLSEYPDGLFAEFAVERMVLLEKQAAATTANVANSDLLATADLEQVSAALGALGLFSKRITATREIGDDLEAAIETYSAQLANPDAASLDQLFTDASRRSMFLAATTLQRIRTDIVALRSVDRTRLIAQDALVQIIGIAASDANALPILQQAKTDMQAIEQSREFILQRLDQSRSYYDEVLTQAVTFLPEDATVALIGGQERARDLAQTNRQLFNDANLFLKHASEASDSRKGSYAWLIDLISEN